MKRTIGIFAVILSTVLISNGFAMDIGSMRPTDTQFSIEIVHENYKRDMRATIPISHQHATGIQEEKRTFVRLSYSPQPNWGITLDAGVTDVENSEGNAPLLGLGGYMVVYQNNNFYASLFAKVNGAFNIEYRNSYTLTGSDWTETGKEKQTEDLWEYGGGVQLGKQWSPCSSGRIVGYTGAMVSYIDSSEYNRGNYVYNDAMGELTGGFSTHDLTMEEDHPLSFFAGIEATLTSYEIGIRAEGRFYDRTSFSVGLFKNF